MRNGLGLYIGVVQFFFATTWTLYVIYLPQLAGQAGIGREWVPWILVADQVVFAITDVATGFWIDRVRAGVARLGGWIMAVTVLSSAAFLALPYLNLTPGLLLGAIFVWAITSSALRSPPWALLSRYAAQPSVPWLATLVLTGSALAAAMAPYLGIALRGVDPKVPFVLSTITLLASVAGLVYAERRISTGTAMAEEEKPAGRKPLAVLAFFFALLLMAAGFQVHFSLNSAPRYLELAPASRLPYLMPVFWIGFNLAMLGSSALVKRLGVFESMAVAAGAGTLAMYCATLASNLDSLLVCEFLAGGCWGLACVAAYSGAIGFGRGGRTGRFLGALFATFAIAAFARIAAYASDMIVDREIKMLLPWIPPLLWIVSAVLLVPVARR